MMNFKTFILLASLLISGTMLLEGCLDAPVMPNGSISGKIYDNQGFPVIESLASAGDYPIAQTNLNGDFVLNDVKFPYDLVIGRYGGMESKYLGLMSKAPVAYDFSIFNIPKFFWVQLTFPPIQADKVVFMKFVSSDCFGQEGVKEYFHTGEFRGGLVLTFPQSSDEINGYILYLEATLDESGENIISYDKFGTKNVTLHLKLDEEAVSFSDNDIKNIRLQSRIGFNVLMPNNYENIETKYYINFPSMDGRSDIELGGTKDLSGSILVPVMDGVDYRIKVSNFYYEPPCNNRYSISGRKWEFVNPGENVTIVHNNPIELLAPVNGQHDISDTSSFTISDPGEKGVYVYTFSTRWLDVSLYTDRTSIKFRDIRSRLIGYGANQLCYWSVQKYPGFNSIDEFVSVNYPYDKRYNSIPSSGVSEFTTAP